MSMENMFNGMFGKIANGMCRLSMTGGIAIKTSNGYKSYNVKTKRLINCSNFALPIGEDFFFLIPTNKASVGDIILANGTPKCVIGVEDDSLKVINYEDSTIENILPERHIFMGNTYFYGKIVSMFGDMDSIKNKNGANKIMKYMLMSQMLQGFSSENKNGSNSLLVNNNSNNMMGMMLAMNMFNGGMGDMFDGMFDGLGDFTPTLKSEDNVTNEEDEE